MDNESKQLKKEIEELKIQIDDLKQKVEKRKLNQIQLPVDIASVNVIAKALQDAGYIIT
jgi:SMC interacting uncharacterized protein involved in chromosome segregation